MPESDLPPNPAESNHLQSLNELKNEIDAAIHFLHLEKKQSTKEGSAILSVLMETPVLANLLNRIKMANDAVYSLATLDNTLQYRTLNLPAQLNNLPTIPTTYYNIGLIATILNFVTLPLIYIASLVLRKPSPVKLTPTAQWLYSGLLLALTVIALIFPPSAIIIGGISTVLAFGSSIYFWDKFNKEKTKTRHKIITATEEIKMLLEVINKQKNEIEKIISKIQNNLENATDEQISLFRDALANNMLILSIPLEQLEKINKQKDELENEYRAMNNLTALDQAFGVSFAITALLGFLISFIAPPIGFVALNTVFFLGVIYGLCRLIVPQLSGLYKKISDFFKKSKQEEATLPSEATPELAQEKKVSPPVYTPIFQKNVTQPEHEKEKQDENAEQIKPNIK